MTYSIVVRDAVSGELGVAVQSAVFGVGTLCPWAEAGVGAVATQSMVRASHGPSGLALMRNGHSAAEALAAVVAADGWRHARQIAMIDSEGAVDAYTGEFCIRYAGHHVGEGYAVQANMMANEGVPEAMATAFEGAQGPLVERLIAALRAAQDAGGDFRGQQSAALRIVSGELPKNRWEGVRYDVRVDDHEASVEELARLCNKVSAGHLIGDAFTLASEGAFEEAIQKSEAARRLVPDDTQGHFLFTLEMATTFKQLALVEQELRRYLQDDAQREYFRRMAEMRLRHDEDARLAIEALIETQDSSIYL